MKPPVCCICAFRDDAMAGLVTFADHRPLPDGMVGHPHGLEWCCGRHLAAARELAHLPSEDAVRQLRERDRRPGRLTRPRF